MKTNTNMYSVIENDKRFSILLKILDSTGSGAAMKKKRTPLTLLAPVDDAFLELSENVFEMLLNPGGKFLAAAILEQHLIPKICLHCEDLKEIKSISTLYGNALKIVSRNNRFFITESQIIAPEIEATNGIVVAIDKLLPIRKSAITLERKTH